MTVYEIVTEKIIKQLEAGVAPWEQPWVGLQMPRNLVSKKAYRGINVFLLAWQGYQSPYWLTYKQATELGGTVRKGEHGSIIVFWKFMKETKKNRKGEMVEKRSAILRYYTVFNVKQCDGIETPEVEKVVNPIEACENIKKGMPNPPAFTTSFRAAYSPRLDTVTMPARNTFESAEKYYSTLFHELTHSTGHKSRVGREGIAKKIEYGSETYSKEELVAEMGSAMLAGVAGIEKTVISHSASYLQNWIERLKGDSRLVVLAAAQAQKAADYILGKLTLDTATEEA